jgi:hypothetical protein
MPEIVASISTHHGVRYLPQLATELRLKTFGILVHQHILGQGLVGDLDFWSQSV